MLLLGCALSLWGFTGCSRSELVQLRFNVGGDAEQVRRLQVYVFDVELRRDDGAWQKVVQSADGAWQNERVALVDLIGPDGERRNVIEGLAPTGSYAGVRFKVGVPFDLNHANQLTASAPLNRAELFWSWQSGYKFLRLELTDEEHAGAFHLGSTGCSSASALRPPQQPCAQPNVIQVELRGFDPIEKGIQVRVADIVTALRRTDRTACTGEYASTACAAAFRATGLDVRTGECADSTCSTQRLFAAP